MKTKFSLLLICVCLLLGINISYTTLAAPPTSQTSNIVITDITSTTATISWTNGDGAKRVVFVENPSGTAAAPANNTTYTASADWNTKGTKIGTSNYYCVYNGSGNSVTLTNLTSDANYTVRISEYNGSAGSEQYLTTTVTSNPKTFSTIAAAPPTTQTSNIVITSITSTSATISWTNGNGEKRIVFVENPSGTAAAPANNTTYTASADWSTKGTVIGSSNYYCVYSGSGNSVTLTNLPPDAAFTVRISEYNGSAGSEQYLTTTVSDNPKSFSTLTASTPSTQASNIVITNKTSTSATISWTNGNGAKRVVFVEYPLGIEATPQNNISYTASNDWNVKGTKLGTSNYYCIFNGSGNSVTLTNLIPSYTYTVKVSEYNGSAGSEFYLTTSVTDNPVTFTTLASGIKQTLDITASASVSPNPTCGVITVKSHKEGEKNITVLNLQGKVVYKVTTRQNSIDIDLTGANSGIYIIKVEVSGVNTICKVTKN